MRLFRVLPALTLLLGARASPRVLDSGKQASHHAEARQIGTNLCVPIGPAATIEELLPAGFAYLTRGNTAAATCLCLSTIPSAIAVQIAQYLYQFAPEPTNELENDFLNAINNGDSTCSYPVYSIPTCASEDRCEFTCISGYTLSGSTCVPNSS